MRDFCIIRAWSNCKDRSHLLGLKRATHPPHHPLKKQNTENIELSGCLGGLDGTPMGVLATTRKSPKTLTKLYWKRFLNIFVYKFIIKKYDLVLYSIFLSIQKLINFIIFLNLLTYVEFSNSKYYF